MMPLIKQTLIIDLINTFWITGVFVTLFVWLPLKSSHIAATKQTNFQIVGFYLRTSLMAIAGVLCLSYLHLLNWLTLALLYIVYLMINYLERYNWQLKGCQQIAQDKVFNLIDILDQGLSFKYLIKAIYDNYQQSKQQFTDYLANLIIKQGIGFIAISTIVLGFVLLLRWEHPLLELRFSRPESYGDLLLTQQILTGQYPETNYLPVFPALAAMLSLLGSIDAMQVIRFLSPILGLIIILGVGYLVCVLTDNAYSALASMFALGAYLFTWKQVVNPESSAWLMKIIDSLNSSLVRQWTGNKLELGVIFVLLGLGYCFNADQQQRKTTVFKINFVCSIILIGMSTPPLLILMAIAPIGLLGGKKVALVAITSTWIILAFFAVLAQGELLWTQGFLLTLPVALSLLTGLLFNQIAEAGKLLSAKWAETFCLALFLALAFNFLLPLAPKLTYVEYEITARKTLEIKELLPRNSWTLAAPVEQLAEIYGSGWYEDLALFVEKYAEQASKLEFNFPVGETDLFVFVEKIPFITFGEQLSTLPNSILGDRTYGYYRSASGRASLEFEALQMCEAYRQKHPKSEVYFENNELRIYRFPAV